MNEIPDIYYDGNTANPCLYSPNAPYAIYLRQTKETIKDTELFKRFIENAVKNFRKSRVYKNYKAYLFELGLNRCQMLGNITSDMATIEMHHNGFTIFDIAVIIATHLINTTGYCTTLDIFYHLRLNHIHNRVPIVMLSKTMHQLEHNDDNFYCPVQMTYGQWEKFLTDYRYGVTYGIARKITRWINKSLQEQIDKGTLNSVQLLIRDKIKEWSEYNEYSHSNQYPGDRFDTTSYGFRYPPAY